MIGVEDEFKLMLTSNAWKNADSAVYDVDASFKVPVLDWKNDELQRQNVVLEFYQNHLLQNMPCLISETATLNWKSRKEWVSEELKPNFEYLKSHFGKATVPVADCDAKEYNAQKKEDMSLMDYLTYWEEVINDDYDYGKHGMLYLKDWHFMRDL